MRYFYLAVLLLGGSEAHTTNTGTNTYGPSGTMTPPWDKDEDYQCAGTDIMIPGYWVCDGIKDCPEADDEVGWGECDRVSTESTTQRPTTTMRGTTTPEPTTTPQPTTTLLTTTPEPTTPYKTSPKTTERWLTTVFSTSPRLNQVKCNWSYKKVPQVKVCDKIWDCPYGDDEDGCYYETTPPPTTTPYPTTTYKPTTRPATITPHWYLCNNTDRYIPWDWICDGWKDCPEADDEKGREDCDWETTPPYTSWMSSYWSDLRSGVTDWWGATTSYPSY